MTTLHVFADDRPQTALEVTGDPARIAELVEPLGVRFEAWRTVDLPPGSPQEAVLQAYADDVQRIQQEGGYATADVISLTPDNPNKAAIRAKFLDEHTHAEDEVRFFVGGRGLFYLHAQGKVFAVLCEQGDLLSVPAGMTHWFDTGPEPEVIAIRIFTNPEGWVADYTGDDIASRFPTLETLA
jgi:1,2-dihydroxy-3-keto-5-methylthiopentene dioxygenase